MTYELPSPCCIFRGFLNTAVVVLTFSSKGFNHSAISRGLSINSYFKQDAKVPNSRNLGTEPHSAMIQFVT